jgi:hypothetical protein
MTVIIEEVSRFWVTASLAGGTSPVAAAGLVGSESQLTAPVSQSGAPSKPFAGDQDEEHAKRGIDEDRHREDHGRPASEKLPDVRLPDPGKVEGGVLAVADESEDGVKGVLVGGEAVNANCEGKNELEAGQRWMIRKISCE